MTKPKNYEIPYGYFLEGFKYVKAKLWPHQRDAVQFIARYVRNHANSDKSGARLISLPTGSGKSGIIATIAHFLPVEGTVLVVVPRHDLRVQLSADMSGTYRKNGSKEATIRNGRFFDKAKIDLKKYPRHVERITRKRDLLEFDSRKGIKPRSWTDKHILVTTIQLLERIWENDGRFGRSWSGQKKVSSQLINDVKLVIFDEGHYEPAHKWAQVFRSFPVPRIVFTATPFRNDLRGFDWATDKDDVFFRTFDDMVKAKKIRSVEVKEVKTLPKDLSAVIDKIEEYRKGYSIGRPHETEVIIRVGSRARVLELANIIKKKGHSFIAIHHRPTTKDQLREGEAKVVKSYPVDHKEPVTYWIHQNKLLEGIDRPQIGVLVVLDKLSSLRAIVQQIGRLTRRSSQQGYSDKGAIVLDGTGEIRRQWGEFKRLEKSLKKKGFASRTPQEVIEKIYKALDVSSMFSPIYAEGRVRDVLNPLGNKWFSSAVFSQIPSKTGARDALDPSKNKLGDNGVAISGLDGILVRKSAQVFEVGNSHNRWKNACEDIKRDSETVFDRVCVVSEKEDGNNLMVLLGISANASPFLSGHAFFDIGLHAVVAYRSSPYVFVFDSVGRDLKRITFNLQPGRADMILSLLRGFDGQRLRSVSAKNTRMGPLTISSRTLRGADLTRVPSSLDDGTHVVTSAAGYTEQEEISETDTIEQTKNLAVLRRYVGVRTRRISDAGQMITVKEYCQWAEDIAEEMRRSRKSHNGQQVHETKRFFKRFAPEAERIPKEYIPLWLLVDLADFEGEFVVQRVDEDGVTAVAFSEAKEIPRPVKTKEFIFPVLKDGLVELKKVPKKERWRGNLARCDGESIEIEVTFKRKEGRYILHSPILDSFRSANKPDGNTILQELNQTQSFSILPEEDGFFYTMGAFFRPGLSLGPDYNDEQTGLLEMLTPLSLLEKIRSEKGKKNSLNALSQTWPQTSLFGLVDAAVGARKSPITGEYKSLAELLQKELGDTLWCICDDMGPERADFIVLTKRGKDRVVVLIHAKAKTEKPASNLSAKQLQEVCAQAIKNLDFLGPRLADHTRDWGKSWTRSKEEGAVIPRIRVAPQRIRCDCGDDVKKLSKCAHKAFESAVSNPSVRREIWLLLGATLKKSALEDALTAKKRSKEQIPPVYLLYATSTVVASSHALLRVFCH